MVLGFGESADKGDDVATLIARKSYSRAIEVIRNQLKIQRNDPRLRMQLADVLVSAGKGKEGVTILLPLADEFAKEGFAAKAISVLKKIQRLEPGRRDIDQRLASLIQEKQRQGKVSLPPASGQGLEIGMEEIGFEPATPPAPALAPAPPSVTDEISIAPAPAATRPVPTPSDVRPAAATPPVTMSDEEKRALYADTLILAPAPRPEPPEPSFDLGETGAPGEEIAFESAPLDLGGAEEAPLAPALAPAAAPALAPTPASEPEPEAEPLPELELEPEAEPSAEPEAEPLVLELEPEAEIVPVAAASPAPVVDQDLLTGEFEDLDAAPEPEISLEPAADADQAVDPMTDSGFADELLSVIDEAFQAFPGATDGPAARDAPPQAGTQIVLSPLFKDFSVEELVAVIQGLSLLTFERGGVILREGEPGHSLYMLTSGTVKAFVKKDGRQVPIGELEEGAFFGELSILTGKPRTATIVATTRCELLELDRATLDAITQTHPHVWDVLQQFASQRAATLP